MNRHIYLSLGVLSLIAGLAVTSSKAQSPEGGKGDAALAHAAASNKTLSLVFYRDWDDATMSMAHVVKGHAEKYSGHAVWNTVQITDPAEKSVVDRYQLSRAPMPMVVTIHPNGAVTGFFSGKVGDAELARTFVSPKKAECMKLLQENQLVLMCLKPADQPYPQAVVQFQSDPMFATRTKVISAAVTDPNEAAFFSELKLAPGQPTTVFIAPPGVLVGKFAPTATKSELAAALHAAGKCCDDKNCKHNH